MLISKRNRSGLVWLLIVALLIAFLPRIIFNFRDTKVSKLTYEELQKVNKEIEEKKSEQESSANSFEQKSRYIAPSKKFDPNEYTLSDWVKLGLSEKQASVILKFTERTIYTNEDLKKIYVLPEELYLLIKDSTYYPSRNNMFNKKETYEKRKALVDINIANPSELLEIPGIGPYFAEKIVEYRQSLGGFIGRAQLLEIWKFDQNKLQEIEDFITLSKHEPIKLDLNNSSFELLKNHPYIDYSVANSIVKMREQEKFKSIDDIKRSKLIDQELFIKLKPYIKVK